MSMDNTPVEHEINQSEKDDTRRLNIRAAEQIVQHLTSSRRGGVDMEMVDTLMRAFTTPVSNRYDDETYDPTQWGDIGDAGAGVAAHDLTHIMLAFGARLNEIPRSGHSLNNLHGSGVFIDRSVFNSDDEFEASLNARVDHVLSAGLKTTELAIESIDVDFVAPRNGPLATIIKGTAIPRITPEEAAENATRLPHVAQLEYIARVYELIEDYSAVASRRAGALILHEFVASVSNLKDPNLQGVYEAGLSIQHTLKQYIDNESDQIVKAYIQNVRGAVGRLSNKLVELFPDILTPHDLTEVNDDIVPPEIPDAPEEQTPTEEEIIEINRIMPEAGFEEINTIEEMVASFNAQWLSGVNLWRENGFSNLMRAFVVDGGAEKMDASRDINTLRLLDISAVQAVAKAKEDIADGLTANGEIRRRLELFKSEYAQYPEARERLRQLSYFDLEGTLRRLTDTWTTTSSSVSQFWPQNTGPMVAARLEKVLFISQDEESTQHIESEPVAKATEQPTDEMEIDEIDALRLIVDQLDEILLPEELTQETLISQLRELGVDSADRINWKKFEDLVLLHKDFGGKLYRSKLKSAGSETKRSQDDGDMHGEVYYTLVCDFYGREYAIAESPMTGNATYVIDVESAPGSWLEMLVMNKREIRELGGKRIIHSTVAPYGEMHREKIIDYIMSTQLVSVE